MRRIFIYFIIASLSFGVVSCKKDDPAPTNNTGGNNTGGGGGGGTTDLLTKALGTYTGLSSNNQTQEDNSTVTLEKISNTRVRIIPGNGNSIITTTEVDIVVNATEIVHSPGSQVETGISFQIDASTTPYTMVLAKNNPQEAFTGSKN